MITDNVHNSGDVRRFYLILGGVIAAAWGLLLALQISAQHEVLDHEAIEHQLLPSFGHLTAFLLGWFLMIVAMMLPGSLPMLNIHTQPLRRRMARAWPAVRLVLGYLFPWVVFGLVVYLGDGVLHWLFRHGTPMQSLSGLVAPSILLAAGLYQLTPLKRSYLKRCQPAHTSMLASGMHTADERSAWRLGLRLGLDCVGSCWSLMLVMFALGHNQLGWMLVLGSLMSAERLIPRGQNLARLVGFVLVAWAVLWLLVAKF
jgi:predicted metal-binding membrane protein